jgi:AcrR family transcriptional regulator
LAAAAVTTRRYHSPRRQQQAQATRRAILEAARRLFAARGYAATTLPAIAHAAAVSPPTVTAAFGTKAGLLEALIRLAVRGDAADAPLELRSWWQEMLQEPDPVCQLWLQASAIRQIHERSADVYEIVRGAATADPEIASLLRERGEQRLDDLRAVAGSLAAKGALAPDLGVEMATDLLWALGAAEMYRLLVAERGWSADLYEEWLAQALIDALLRPGVAGS